MRLARPMCIFALSAALTFTGCAPLPPRSDPLKDSAAKSFRVADGKAAIYIYRAPGFVGSGVMLDVFVDGRLAGSIAGENFIRFDTTPGTHVVTCQGVSLEVEVKPGGVAYVLQDVRVNPISPGNELSEVNEAKGRAGVLRSYLVGK